MSWPIFDLGGLTRIRTGKLDANAANENGLYPFFTCARESLFINTPAFDCKAVLVAGNGDLNVKYYEGKFNAYQRTYVIESLDDSKLLPKYLYLFLDGYVEKLRELAIGGVIKYIKLGNLTDAKLPLPSISEQQRIVAILDKASEIQAKREQTLSRLDELTQGVFVQMFGNIVVNTKSWDLVQFENICPTRLGKMLDQKQQTGENKKKYLRNANVRWFEFDLNDLLEMDFDENAQKIFKLEAGDILICEGGEPGRAAIWMNEVEDCYYQKALHRGRVNLEFTTPEYVVWALWMYAKYGGLKDYMTSSTIAHLTGEKLKAMIIPLPPLQLQKEFSKILNQLKSFRLKLDQDYKKIIELNNSLQQKAFTTGFDA
ncbi:restriction endonuclease subunit S [Ferrovum sp. PN-J185]|uniref:restriction endonuclease subunit S n=1 Tax=Ferrovum sp. PN-J185 TaxID=1356306 RepID=UPI001E5A88A0|nr:restriction endonuclease subunit S [Ferrovum sp. PN-J185]MCC6067687.1 restriction endonuclease subunit S [Ferrovum sp. PN-J185]